jgi:lipopolysaccharide export LptBFGC system permease protein LptF
MASGVSLKRVIAPIIVLSVLLTSLVVIDQEIVIPRLVSQLVRGHDYDRAKGESYDFWFLTDSNGHLISANNYVEREETMYNPLMVIRRQIKNEDGSLEWIVLGDIKADKARYNHETKKWDLENAVFSRLTAASDEAATNADTFETDITPTDIPIRQQENYKSLLSSAQLSRLANEKTTLNDQADLYSQKNFRITDPILNLVMLMVALPVLVCRDPKSMKAAVVISFSITASCFLVMFGCKMVATEAVFGRIIPHFWAWLPVIIFLPIAFIELDSMKT